MNKRNSDWKRRCKSLTFAHNIILYIENPKDDTRKLLELINEYSKVTEYKINTQKFLAFLYTKNEKSEREIKETTPFITATKRINFLGISLPKLTKDLYAEKVALVVKNSRQCRRHERHGFNSWVGKIPWRRAQQPTPVFLPAESLG